MSKHSRWSKVKHQKGPADAKRAAIFTKMARVITVAARDGGGDPNFNFKLRSAIDQALEANLPKDNIDRAIKKGTGEIAAERIEEIVYEGYGPGGAAIMVEALTDNRNRTSSNLKHAFSIGGGNLAAQGAVQWMFERKGIVRLRGGKPSDDAELALIDAGADDIAAEDEGVVVSGAPDAVARIRDAAAKQGMEVAGIGFEWIAKEKAVPLDAETKEKLEGLFEALDEDEDVNAIYSNYEG
ncbi:MAG TPA: YebC/PmpR family DNA-binding transcriptional regulator [Candidatus Binatia bacterium]|nr:YebC/PmpR family DNA-binding transcriptional regulator [Candidatus Binatia bacterium]